MPNLLRIYLVFRKPKNFLILLCIFIASSLALHFSLGVDGDFGATNLILSIEASTAGAVLMMIAEESAVWQKEHTQRQSETLEAVLKIAEASDKSLRGVLLIAEAQRDMLTQHTDMLRVLRDSDERLLQTLTNGARHATDNT